MELKELKENMYVRTKEGNIYKLIKEIGTEENKIFLTETDVIVGAEILKARFKIIDLVEKGDYVNGYPVEDIYTGIDNRRYFEINGVYNLENKDIETIMTKEQYHNNCYKL